MKQIALIILDGWGYREDKKDNAISEAETPFFDSLWCDYPHTLLSAGEKAVGLPEGTMGNSEVGHMTLGAGRKINTDLVRISEAIKTGEFKTTPAFVSLFNHVKKYNSTLHVLGLLSPIGVHSHQDHLHEFLKLAKEKGVEKIAIHAFTDGRDSPPQESAAYLRELEKVLGTLNIGYIATAMGRYYAMDRDKNWNRTELAEQALFENKGKKYRNRIASEVLKELHNEGALDEHLEPVIFLDTDGKGYGIEKNDGIFFFNFRTDRPRQLCYKIMERAKGGKENQNIMLATMTEYAPDIESVAAFPPVKIQNTLAEEIAKAGLSQTHIAETEKYAHVTYFFNGERPQLHKNEKHILIESHKDVKTHDLAPEMRAREIADAAIKSIAEGVNLLVINFANADMVGHTANKKAIIKAVEIVDHELGRVVAALIASGGIALITADHGNAEINIDPITGEKHTAHTLSKVPAIITQKGLTLHNGTLADVAPTILELYGLPIPKEMTGKKLF
jgi:2,3-bisphosphoglycerate-independent phosphoglycerate mutase